MDQTRGMDRYQTASDLMGDTEGLGFVEDASPTAQQGLAIAPRHQLQNLIRATIAFAVTRAADDVRIHDLGCRANLTQETRGRPGVVIKAR